MRNLRFCLALPVLLLAVGCAHPLGHLTVVSNQNIDGLDQIAKPVSQARVSAESCRSFILFIPISSRPDLDDALAEAVRKAPEANALSDVAVKRDGLFTLFYNKQCYVVEGTPIRIGRK